MRLVRLMMACTIFVVTVLCLMPQKGSHVLADSVQGPITAFGNVGSPTFGNSDDFFYAIDRFEETVGDHGVYLSNFLKISTSDLQVLSTTRLEFQAYGIALNSAGTFAFVYGVGARISRVNLTTFAVTNWTLTGVDSDIGDFVVDSAGSFGYGSGSVYLSDIGRSNSVLFKINLTSGSSVRFYAIEGPDSVLGVALDESRNRGCFVNNSSGQIGGFRLSPFEWSDSCISDENAGLNPAKIHFDKTGTYGYISVAADKKLLKFDLSTGQKIKTISFPNYTSSFRLNPASTFAYVIDDETSPSFLYKVSLVTFEIVERIPIQTGVSGITISPNGSLAVVVAGNGLQKISLSATAPQSITFVPPVSQLTGVRTVSLGATASSGLSVSYRTTTPEACTVSGAVSTLINEGNCTLVASQSGSNLWEAAADVAKSFKVYLSPLSLESGISISAGKTYSNSKNVSIEIKWPEYADSVRLSNDGGFGSAVTQTKKLSSSIDWTLDDSVRGIYTKVVYARFTGEGIDTTKTYSDDIILDTNAPVVESSSAAAVSGSIDVTLRATDDITGVDKVQIRNGSTTVTKDYSNKVSVTQKEIGISVSSAALRKLGMSSIEVRVSDKAGNWSEFKILSLAGIVSAPTVSSAKAATAKSIATYAKLVVSSTSKISLKVIAGYAKYCKVTGAMLKGLKTGSCKVTVTVTPKKGRSTSKTVTLKIAK